VTSAMAWARRLVGALADAGVRDAIVSPGSRSTPLVLALAEEGRVTTEVVLDERSAAFCALGIARATGRTPLLVATSGTAGAHWLPAILEAGNAEPAEPGSGESSEEVVRNLRDKWRIAEQRLETIRQEHGLAYEDLRAANEELQSLNEEYRSTTEELETSKEELQSVNEELQTVNTELKMKLEEVSRANNDLENFMSATDIPMLFLDRSLCIKRYTAPLRHIFNVKAYDLGRPIGDLTHNLAYDELELDVRRVLTDLSPVEREVKAREGGAVTVRLRPYRTAEDRIDGDFVAMDHVEHALGHARLGEQLGDEDRG